MYPVRTRRDVAAHGQFFGGLGDVDSHVAARPDKKLVFSGGREILVAGVVPDERAAVIGLRAMSHGHAEFAGRDVSLAAGNGGAQPGGFIVPTAGHHGARPVRPVVLAAADRGDGPGGLVAPTAAYGCDIAVGVILIAAANGGVAPGCGVGVSATNRSGGSRRLVEPAAADRGPRTGRPVRPAAADRGIPALDRVLFAAGHRPVGGVDAIGARCRAATANGCTHGMRLYRV